MAEIDELTVVERHRFKTTVRVFHEDFGFVPGRPQYALDAEHLVSDRVAVPEGRQALMNPDHCRIPAASAAGVIAAPRGNLATTPRAGGRSRRRRSSQPG